MLTRRLVQFITPALEPGEAVGVAMAGFRPISRTAVFVAVLPSVLAGFALSSAAGWGSWIGGGIGAGTGAGIAMWLDQRRARAEHGGKGLALGLVVTDRRLLVVELHTGPIVATPERIEHSVPLIEIGSVEVERMQGSGLKRPGVVITVGADEQLRMIPARHREFMAALGRS